MGNTSQIPFPVGGSHRAASAGGSLGTPASVRMGQGGPGAAGYPRRGCFRQGRRWGEVLRGDLSLALSQRGCSRVFWVSSTDPMRGGRGTSQGMLSSPGHCHPSWARRGVWLSAVNEEVTALCHQEVTFSPLPVNYPLQPRGWSGLPPGGTGRMTSYMRRSQMAGWGSTIPWSSWFTGKQTPPSETTMASGNTLVTPIICAKSPSWPGGLSPSLPLCRHDGILEAGAVAAGGSSPAACGHCAEDQRLQHQDIWGQQDVQQDYRKYHCLCECWGERSRLWSLGCSQLGAVSWTPAFCRHPSICVSIRVSTHPSIHLSKPLHPSTYASIHLSIHTSIHQHLHPSVQTFIHTPICSSSITISNLGPSPFLLVPKQGWAMLGAAQIPHSEQPASEELLGWWVVDGRVLEGTVSHHGSSKSEDTSRGAPSLALGSLLPSHC